ncbi:helix-turn-helix domain-containing protein [Serratia ficaria]|uniref:Antitoxin HigA n=1 Tax=Serratia ficaria TaxID=61651 RepID=A0A240CCP0_SERFI|nr:helix-turn-helix domain-containing protein [Serratia ficaria]MEE4484020.1 helix-turn-helix domain-containing protein [Serratia ficaria]REF42943.1 HTH-type transcriptional regulator/antitoxin HigA [Serratia ficaria]CAI0813186.1 Antitoxin HigA [Serratia ficaria]CAI1049438.1 Antitoxin HigA [Serratia ficaria]CAI1102735.1 Antitoxin HigA [Serratia ficaria]
MISDAIKATQELLRAVPLLRGSTSQQDYRQALELVEHLLETDEHNPLIDLLAAKIAEFEESGPDFAEFNLRQRQLPQGVAALSVLMEQHQLSQRDFENEIGKKSLVSQILNGKRSLTIPHIMALAKRFNLPPAIFLPEAR